MNYIDKTVFSGSKYRPHFDFWKSFIDSHSEGFHLQKESIIPLQNDHCCCEFTLQNGIINPLLKLVKDNDNGLFVALTTALGILLRRYTDQHYILIDTPLFENEPTGDIYQKRVALPLKIKDQITLREQLSEIKATIAECYIHQNFPYSLLMEDKCLNTNVIVVYDGLHHTSLDIYSYDLIVRISRKEDVKIKLEYNPASFNPCFIEQIASHLHEVLSCFSNLESLVGEIDILSISEKKQILEDFNTTGFAHPESTIQQLFEAQVTNNPEATAIVFNNSSITYQELNESANRLAHCLREQYQVKPDDVIGLMVDRSENMIIALLGIIKAGAAYLPIDPTYPKERKEYILADAQVKLLLTESDLLIHLENYTGDLFALDIQLSGLEDKNHNPDIINKPSDLAYIIYTSGSTGQPKGVMIEHRSQVNMSLSQIKQLEVAENDKVLQFASLSFDASVYEIFMALYAGATLVLISRETIDNTDGFINYLKEKQVNIVTLPPVYLATLKLNTLSFLRVIITAGEAANVQDAIFCSEFSDYYNAYGPTECTVCVTTYKVSDKDKEKSGVPIGKPIDNLQIYILSKDLKLQPIGVEGEIYVGGKGLARGYLNRKALTEEKFIQNPFKNDAEIIYKTGDFGLWLTDGNIEFSGRKDNQIKIRGHRVETLEIESVIRQYESIKDVHVFASEGSGKEKELIAALVPYKEDNTLISHLKSFLGEKLPSYMIPSNFVCLHALPVNAHGKVDRKMLQNIVQKKTEVLENFVSPSEPVECLLAEIWQSILDRDALSVNDDFFEIGGDSIKAIQIASRMHKAGYKLEVKDIFESSTIKGLADRVIKIERLADQNIITGVIPLVPIQKQFFEYPRNYQHHFNQSVFLRSAERLDVVALQAIFNKIYEHHDALRIRFQEEEGFVLQVNSPIDQSPLIQVYDWKGGKQDIKAMEEQANELQASLKLNGDLIKIALFKLEDGDRLLIIIHHLVIDGVSWRILLEDIESLYQKYQQKEPLTLPWKTDSFRLWSERLCDYARSESREKEKKYWKQQESILVPSIPSDYNFPNNFVKDLKTCSFFLTEEDTNLLLTQVNHAYNTEINDILLIALGLSVKECFGRHSMRIALEGHGREKIFEEVDINRTVGWFTSVFPVVIDSSNTHDLSRHIKEVKEQLRKIPNKGIGYGILKYLALIEELNTKPQISFNYLGQMDGLLSDSFFTPAKESKGNLQSPEDEWEYEIDVTGMIQEKRLTISIRYNKNHFIRNTIATFSDCYKAQLENLITHCSDKEEKELSPSDFVYKELSIEELENFFN